MAVVTSPGGTTIAYERTGDGPPLVLDGGAGPQPMRQAAQATAEAIPSAGYRTLDGQTHDVSPDALAPVLVEFFRA